MIFATKLVIGINFTPDARMLAIIVFPCKNEGFFEHGVLGIPQLCKITRS